MTHKVTQEDRDAAAEVALKAYEGNDKFMSMLVEAFKRHRIKAVLKEQRQSKAVANYLRNGR